MQPILPEWQAPPTDTIMQSRTAPSLSSSSSTDQSTFTICERMPPIHGISGDRERPGSDTHYIEPEASVLIEALVGNSSDSIFSTLGRILSIDPTLPSIDAMAEMLRTPTSNERKFENFLPRGSAALAPRPELNAVLTQLVQTLVTPRPCRVDAAAISMLDDPNAPWLGRAAAIRAVAAAAERELELISAANTILQLNRISAKSLTLQDALSVFPYFENYELLVHAEIMILHRLGLRSVHRQTCICSNNDVKKILVVSHDSAAQSERKSLEAALDCQRSLGCSLPMTAIGQEVVKETAEAIYTCCSDSDTAHENSICTCCCNVGFQALSGTTVAICGSGPMPLTGILLNARAGARVVLVDIDEEAIATSRELIYLLEDAGILESNMFQFVCADAGNVHFRHSRLARGLTGVMGDVVTLAPAKETAFHGNNNHPTVYCDALILASLVSESAKLDIAKALTNVRGEAPEVILVRSAEGLTARLAYNRVDSMMLRQHLTLCGVWVPRASVICTAYSHSDIPADHMKGALEKGVVRETICANILNSVEAYRCK